MVTSLTGSITIVSRRRPRLAGVSSSLPASASPAIATVLDCATSGDAHEVVVIGRDVGGYGVAHTIMQYGDTSYVDFEEVRLRGVRRLATPAQRAFAITLALESVALIPDVDEGD